MNLRGLPAGVGLLLAMTLLGLATAGAAVIHGPMLQGATTTNLYVLVEATTTPPLTVNYGPTTAYGSTATTSSTKSTGANPVTYVHRIKLTGLQPDSLYHYQLRDGATIFPDYTFRTYVQPGVPFRFAWSADFRNGTAVHGQISGRILNSHKTPRAPLFDLTGGDYASDGTYPNWTNQWLVTAEKELEKWMPTYFSAGNHEGWSTQLQAFSQAPDSTGANGYYSFDCGDLHVIVGNYRVSYTSGSAQYNWIQQDASSSLKPWKIFVFHAPAYTYGGTGSHTGDSGLQTICQNLLEPNGVKAILAGHNHFYQHNLVRGVRHLTVGAAGAPLYAVGSDPTYTVRSASDNCYLIADVTSTNLHMVVYNNAGTTLDTIDLIKLPAPAGLSVAPGNHSAALSWNAVSGATSYTVSYGTKAGGPYPLRQNTSMPNATIGGLADGTPYFFVVTATDTNGPSAPSSQASLTLTPPVLTVTGYAVDSQNTLRMNGIGQPFGSHVLLMSTNLAPGATWSAISTNAAGADGLFIFADPQVTNSPQRFYKVLLP